MKRYQLFLLTIITAFMFSCEDIDKDTHPKPEPPKFKVKKISSIVFPANTTMGGTDGCSFNFSYKKDKLTRIRMNASNEVYAYNFLYNGDQLSSVEQMFYEPGSNDTKILEKNVYSYSKLDSKSILIQRDYYNYTPEYAEQHQSNHWARLDTLVLNDKGLLIQQINSGQTASYVYDASDNLVQINMPSGQTYNYTYDNKVSMTYGVEVPSWFWVYEKSGWHEFAGSNNALNGSPFRLSDSEYYFSFDYDSDGYPTHFYNAWPDGNRSGEPAGSITYLK